MAIQSFSDKTTQIFFKTGTVNKGAGWGSISRITKRKLDMLHYAVALGDLKAPPGNRLELLKGDLMGYYSIRINDQWRVIFKWAESGPYSVKITDYH
ncbi:MAG: type II toxin-antitoxin system RelE/ParE family toxin [Spirochaetaceae bacterium]|nr:type II toxin-antitoxin system RelE/ParE family toxin [Spirochaetaceae bacterium]